MSWFKEVMETYNKGLEFDSLLGDKISLQKELISEIGDHEITLKDKEDLEVQVVLLNTQIVHLQELALEDQKASDLELLRKKVEEGGKYRKTLAKQWPARGKRKYIDIVDYCTTNNTKVKVYKNKALDDVASTCLNYVSRYFKYTSDEKEFWQYADESVSRMKGDCEDGAIMMYNMMVASGVPSWRLRLNAGLVDAASTAPSMGHAWVTYLREKDNQWIVLDWCYYPSQAKKGLLWKDAEHYHKIWFSWNDHGVWEDSKLDRG